MKVEQAAWAAIKEKYDEHENGVWSQEKVTA
jgi:cation transport regulator ChaB